MSAEAKTLLLHAALERAESKTIHIFASVLPLCAVRPSPNTHTCTKES